MTEQESYTLEANHLIEELKKMQLFPGRPVEFWPLFLERASILANAVLALILVRETEENKWKNMSGWPVKRKPNSIPKELLTNLFSIADQSEKKPNIFKFQVSLDGNVQERFILGIPIDTSDTSPSCVSIFLLDDITAENAHESATKLSLISSIPLHYQRARSARHEDLEINQFAEALDVMALLNTEKKFIAAAMSFCNEVSSRYKCSRVSLGWLTNDYVRLQAISHMERFEKKMDIVQKLETAMEEAFDQNEEIIFPSSPFSTTVTRDHELYSREQGITSILSLPIRLGNEAVGVVCCERIQSAFIEEELLSLRVLCDQAARRLTDLKENDRWFGAKIASIVKSGLSRLFGVEHTFYKLLGFSLSLALCFLIFGKLLFRIEAPFILKSDDVKYLPAPFDGYIDKVHVEVGDIVEVGNPLLSLDTEELYLEESSAIANHNRYSREAEKARAQNALADMKIAAALTAQAEARLAQVRYLISHSEIRAPFDGIVVEGDLEELQGAPVRKGDVLFKIARLQDMYIELEVNEKDIHETEVGKPGEIAFISQPDLKFPFEVERIDPVAIAKEDGNVFLVRCRFSEKTPLWWRPGMSGIGKINVEKRNILWILTHRTLDFFRILLWW